MHPSFVINIINITIDVDTNITITIDITMDITINIRTKKPKNH